MTFEKENLIGMIRNLHNEKMNTRKGFSLIELLIAVLVICILAMAMMLASGSGRASADATVIINNLRGLRSACVAFYLMEMDRLGFAGTGGENNIALLAPYMSDPSILGGAYKFVISDDGYGEAKWWVGFDFDEGEKSDKVKEKLFGRARTLGLYGNEGGRFELFNKYDYKDVWMLAR
ncbi:MAG: type II secretion system GspH family protein [Synergistaceae bacterium]|nr:type II secretion system GspH family protein [Synergistaceae bacterium]